MNLSDTTESVFESAIENFLGPVLNFLKDPEISEILINGPNEIFIERGGRLQKTDARFLDEDSLQAAVNSIAQSVGRRINQEEPRLDARLPDGSRIHAVLPPCARSGTTVSIRKFFKTKLTLKDLIAKGTITKDAAQFLDICMFLGKNILVSGGTGSGKTTLLGVLCSRVPRGQRIIVIEDATELSVEHEHVVRFETRLEDAEGKGEVTMKHLLKSALRLRPDRIVVGEVRGHEAMELISAMNTGHRGCLGTIHANTPIDAALRLEALALGGEARIGEKALQQQISSAVHLIVQINRFSDGSRKIQSIAEIIGNDSGRYKIQPIYDLSDLKAGESGLWVGEVKPTGQLPTFMAEIESAKIPFGRDKFSN